MEKLELLKSVGFSNEFIEQIEKFENGDLYNFQNGSFSNEDFNFTVHDSSELYMEKQLNKDSHMLKIK